MKYQAVCAGKDDALYICEFYRQNLAPLHGEPISLAEWQEFLSADDPDERNFLICENSVPVAWLKVNGLENTDIAWISMLVVGTAYQRRGVGRFAMDFAEDYLKGKEFRKIGIHTTEDNAAARCLYGKCGYTEIGIEDRKDGLGEVTLEKKV